MATLATTVPAPPQGQDQARAHSLPALMLGAVGVVYGDIGTSPLYTMKESFIGAHPLTLARLHVFGVLSLIVWSLMLVVTIKYVVVAMRADNKGEGGSFALLALISRTLGERKWTAGLVTLGVLATALFYGDAMITPAISVLSAVEGLTIVQPALETLVIPIAIVVLIALFVVQSRGTAKVGAMFGPLVLVYFAVLAIYFLLPAWREYPEMSQPLWKFLLSVQNIALHGGTAFSHAWSLAVEDQFYVALPFLLLFLYRRPRPAIIVPCLIVVGGIGLRAFLAAQNASVDGGVSFRGFQAWIYYPTWTRLDPLVLGVVVAGIERFRPNWWQRLINCASWLWLPGLGLIVDALYLGETENLTIGACVWQFPLIAVGMAAILVCAVSPRLLLCRVAIPGAAFIASIAYSAYLIQKLVINGVAQFCINHNVDLTSAPALLGVELCVYIAATVLFLSIERPFLLLRRRLAPPVELSSRQSRKA